MINPHPLRRYENLLERALFITLSGLAISFFCSSWGVNRFSMWSIYILLALRFLAGYEPVRTLPRWLLLITALSLVSFTISALISEDKTFNVSGFKDYRMLFLAGLLYTAPVSDKLRKYVFIIFVISASIGGFLGILQYFGLLPNLFPKAMSGRAIGFAAHPVIYATQLAFACAVGVLVFIFKESGLHNSKRELFLVFIIIVVTWLGILYSQTRSMWFALFAACLVSLYFYNRRKVVIFILFSIAAMIVVVAPSGLLKQRLISIATSVSNPQSDSESTLTRLKLWKGAVLIFHESPLFGTGIGDFQHDIDKLIQSKKIDIIPEPSRGNAHSSFFHTLATQGLVGIVTLVGLYGALLVFAARKIQAREGIGGYVILSITIVLIVGGLTVPFVGGIGMGVIITEYCFIFGLLGSYRSWPLTNRCLTINETFNTL
jgi:O-antigen ligase